VCRAWKALIESSVELTYLVELFADGLVSCPSADSMAQRRPYERLEQLRRYRRAWQSLTCTSCTRFSISGHARAYDLVDGVYAQHDTWPLTDFTTIALPTAERESRASTFPDVGVQSLDFAIDPTQDLVVFLWRGQDSANLDCRLMSTLAPHPLAALDTLSLGLRQQSFQRIFLQIADDAVGLLYRIQPLAETLRLVIFNWRTAVLLVDLSGPQLPRFTSDFSLISPRSFLLGTMTEVREGTNVHRGGIGEIRIFSFRGDSPAQPEHATTLLLPEVDVNRSLDRMVIHSGPYLANPPQDALFYKPNEKRICSVSLLYDRFEAYTLYIHHQFLAGFLPPAARPPIAVVPWKQWGPGNSRMMKGRHMLWLRSPANLLLE
ncbi:unnamed protein product, partial [Mycena citricolor]